MKERNEYNAMYNCCYTHSRTPYADLAGSRKFVSLLASPIVAMTGPIYLGYSSLWKSGNMLSSIYRRAWHMHD